jgi:hypothetical protein
MKLWEQCLYVAIACTIGNFLVEAVFDHAWLMALDRSLECVNALLTLAVANRYFLRNA